MQQRAQQRQMAHEEIKSLMKKGQLEEALTSGQNVVASLGPHVGLLCDIAACQYEMARFESCKTTVVEISKNFRDAYYLLSESSKRRTSLFLAKLLEEQGDVAECLNQLNQSIFSVQNENEVKIIQSQELRILSFLGQKSNLAKKYQLLTEKIGKDESLQVEILHGLLWAEWSLFGFGHAVKRWQSLKEINLNPIDKRLIARDFLEICLFDDNSDPRLEAETCEWLKTSELLPYDQILIEFRTQWATKVDLTDGFSFMMKVRILLLQIKYAANADAALELRKKFYFLLECLSKESAEMMRLLLPPAPSDQKIILNLEPKQNYIEYHGKFKRLTGLQSKLFEAFMQQKSLPLEDVVRVLWNEDWTTAHYHRIRMLVYKLNTSLQIDLGISVFQTKKAGVSLNQSIEIKLKV